MREVLSARILIVDEDPQTVGILRAMLAKAGYRSVESTTEPRLAPAVAQREGSNIEKQRLECAREEVA